MSKPFPPYPELKQGIYRHYKGGLYQVIGFIFNATEDQWYVKYVPASYSEIKTEIPLEIRVEDRSTMLNDKPAVKVQSAAMMQTGTIRPECCRSIKDFTAPVGSASPPDNQRFTYIAADEIELAEYLMKELDRVGSAAYNRER